MGDVGCQSMVGTIQLCLLKSPRQSHHSQDTVDAQWQALHYLECPDFARVLDEYAGFVDLLGQQLLQLGALRAVLLGVAGEELLLVQAVRGGEVRQGSQGHLQAR